MTTRDAKTSAAPATAALSASPADGAATPGQSPRPQADAMRTVRWLMLFRVGLATLLLISMVAAKLSAPEVALEELSAPFARFGFGVIALTYLVSLIYAIMFPRVRRPVRFAFAQIAVDLAMTTVVVHATGGGESGFCFLYLVDVVAVALLAQRRGAAIVAAVGVALMVGVSVLGATQVLPLVPGQVLAPWDFSRAELASRLALNVAGLVSVGFLASALAAQNRRADERLVKHEAWAGDLARLHENTIRCLSSGLVTLDPQGRVTTANSVACEILGTPPHQLIGTFLASVLPGLPLALAEAGPEGTVRRVELSAQRPDGSVRHVGISAAPLTDHGARVIGRVIHFQDLTELKRMEVAVARAERLATVGRLAAAIAHEIRNPLASISGSIEMLRDQPGPEADNRKLMDIAVREVDRLNALIASLLDYARPHTEERRRIDLGEDVAEIVQAFERERRDARQPITVRFTSAGPVPIDGAGGQLRQVVWNLLRNAADAMPSGGILTITVAREAGSAPGATEARATPVGGVAVGPNTQHGNDRDGEDGEGKNGEGKNGEGKNGARGTTTSAAKARAMLVVADTGGGIPTADLEHIFEPFFSTKEGGTGLGLATVARIIDDHKGTIDVDSTMGRGTTFTIRLPMAGSGRVRVELDHAA